MEGPSYRLFLPGDHMVETNGYLLFYDQDGEVQVEGALAAGLVREFLVAALGKAMKDKLQNFWVHDTRI